MSEIRQFWLEVQEAHDVAIHRPYAKIDIARNGHKAVVTYEPATNSVVIIVTEADTRARDPLVGVGEEDE